MRSFLPSRRSSPSLLLVLALGCGDPVPQAGDDEAGDSPTGSESADSSNDPEAGSQGNEANEASTSATGSGTDTDSSSSESGETLGTDTSLDTTGGETEQPVDCTVFDLQGCESNDLCVPYEGMPYIVSIDGLICLGPPQFLGCLFAAEACLPATGTLCMGDQPFAVDNLCPAPQGFIDCEPPVDNALPCMP